MTTVAEWICVGLIVVFVYALSVLLDQRRPCLNTVNAIPFEHCR